MAIDLVTLKDPRSPAADAFRTLRTNLLFSSVDQTITKIGATSPALDHGKSHALANLAVTIAQSGRRTILVDADLRMPAQHTLWQIKNDQGLTTMLLEDQAFENPPLIQTEVQGLSILPSGVLPPNPVDVLAAVKMDAVINRLLENADFLLFDMPPVLIGADTLVLGQKLDGVILMVQANKTRRDHTSKAKQQLERVGVKLLGAVLLYAPIDRSARKSYR